MSKRRLLKLAEETSSFSSAEDETSTIAAKPMSAAAQAKPAHRPSRPIEKGIMIRDQVPQDQTKNQAEAEASDKDEDEDPEIKRKGKKPVKKAPMEPSRESTPFPIRRALLEVAQNRMRSEAWVQKQKDKSAGVSALAGGASNSMWSLKT